MSFARILGLLVLFAFSCNFQDTESGEVVDEGRSSSDYEVLTYDGVWCWFSDPRAIYYKGDKEQIYFGYINSRGDVMIGARDELTKGTSHFTLHDSLEVDDHNVPAILFLPDGKMLAFYNEHNGDVFMRKSKMPEDISQWEEERVISKSDDKYRYTYVNPVRLEEEGGRIYLFGRKVGPTRSFADWWHYYKYSDDDGESWSEDVIYLDNEGRVNPPYLKLVTDHESRIDFLFTDGHPKIGSDVSVFHMYYEDGIFKQTSGEQLAQRDEMPIPIKRVDKIYDAGKTNIRGWIWDLALDQHRNPIVTYARFPHENDHRYHYAFWKDGSWQDEEICRSGGAMPALRQGDVVREAHYSGGIVLDHSDPNNVYLSRDVYGNFEIEHRSRNNDGSWASEFLTTASMENNVRPYVVYNSPIEKPMVLWMHGDYNHYTKYSTKILMKE